jgi:hypothetical protein
MLADFGLRRAHDFTTYGWRRPGNGHPHSASAPVADTEQVTSPSVAVEHAYACRRRGPRTVVDEAFVRTPNFAPDGRDRPADTPVRTAVGCHLLARRCSDRGLLKADRSEECGQRGAHYLAVYGRQRPAQTLVHTAVSARFMVRMGSPVRCRRGLHQAMTSANAGDSCSCGPLAGQ